ncbi:MAG TPA: SpoIIE family protein phosphatase [Dermatophilaceae bacterium]|nr:SpoIIE family protein phosphatase [Dermatophilaceae bacterium]
MTGRSGTPRASGPASARLPRHTAAHLRSLLLVGAAYYLGARLGLSLSLVQDNVTPLWPPTGIALAAFLLLGRAMWLAVAVAAFAVNLPIGAGVLPAAATAVGNTLAPLMAAILLLRVGFRRQLDRQRDALAIVFLGALASMLVSATIGAGTLAMSREIPISQLPTAWAVWWTGDAMGVLVVAPFLLSLPLFRESRKWPLKDWLEAGAILVVVAVVMAWTARSQLHLLFLTLPVLGWASWRLQLRGAAPAALIASLMATWSAAHGLGPFERGTLFERMFTLQAFNACVALTSFFLAALVSERIQAAHALSAAAAELEERVRLRTSELSAANARLLQEIQERSDAQEQLSQEEARAQREHQIAETLQRSLLPDRIPDIPGVAVAARYVPAPADVQVGGDWYDVVQLSGGLIGLAIGDVAGHGIQAASTMAQLRMAVRAYAVEDPSPVSVMRGVHRLVAQLPVPEMVTLMYLVFDPATRELRFVNAGHPPGLVIGSGQGVYLTDGLAPPIGVTAEATFAEASHTLPPGATLLLYTDGLVERRGVSIREGLDRLTLEAVAGDTDDVDDLCDRLLSSVLEEDHADDVALVAMRPLPLAGRPFAVRLPAEARVLVQMRAALRRWLRESEVPKDDASEILVACGEACANIVQHAYIAAAGDMTVEARLVDGLLEMSVRDQGEWRLAADRGGGWGLQLMRALMDRVDLDHGPGGTEVRMRRRIQIGGDW